MSYYGESFVDLTHICSAGEEADDNARVWRVYQDRMNAMDEDTILAWNDSINFLLVFVSGKRHSLTRSDVYPRPVCFLQFLRRL